LVSLLELVVGLGKENSPLSLLGETLPKRASGAGWEFGEKSSFKYQGGVQLCAPWYRAIREGPPGRSARRWRVKSIMLRRTSAEKSPKRRRDRGRETPKGAEPFRSSCTQAVARSGETNVRFDGEGDSSGLLRIAVGPFDMPSSCWSREGKNRFNGGGRPGNADFY